MLQIKYGLENEMVILVVKLMFLLVTNFYQFKGAKRSINKSINQSN
jgi:hypothetical protein